MKSLILAALLIASPALAVRKGAPFIPEVDKRFDTIENQLVELDGDATENDAIARKYLRAVYDVSEDGGESTSHDLGVDLPAGAIITSMFIYINEAFADSGTGSVALQCAGTRDLMGYRDLTAYAQDTVFARWLPGADFEGTSIISEGVANAPVLASSYGASVPTACSVTAVVRGDSGYVAQNAGKFTAVIEYLTRE